MYRDISHKLKEWKNSDKHKPLIIVGARQVGKTYSVREFGLANYKSLLEINLQDDVKTRNFFSESRSIKDILSYIELNNLGYELNKDTLLFFDEIQTCPELITALKYFAEKCESDVICSGSMLGVKLHAMSSFPVGYVEMINMYPMTFTEFLIANAFPEKYIEEAKESIRSKTKVPEVIHEKLNEMFSRYVVCGGLPEAVGEYVRDGLAAAVKVNRRLVRDYEIDIAHYADSKTKVKALECFQSLPLQLSKDNKKFQYKVVREGYNARYYDDSLAWLKNAGIVYAVHRLSRVEAPLEINKELGIFKIYYFDTGLLVSQFSDSVIESTAEDTLGTYKGVVYENITAQMLTYAGYKCYYYEPSQTSEIDFVIEYEGGITPMEVKGGIRVQSRSFDNFIKNHHSRHALRVSKKNTGVSEDGIVRYIPHYGLEWIL